MTKRVRTSKKTVAQNEVVIAMIPTPGAAGSVGAEINMDDLDALLADEALFDLDTNEPEIEVRADDSAIDDSAIDELMSEIEAEARVAEEPVPEALGATEEDLKKVAGEIAIEEARQELYAEQKSTVELKDEPTEKKAKAPKEKKERAPRMTLEALSADAFVLSMSDAEDDLEANKAAVIARKPGAKKVAEKFENTLLAVAAGKLPSVYTVAVLKAMRANGGSITSKQAVDALLANNYSDGTARAQANQMFTLLPALKIADRTGNVLTLNEESTLAMTIFAMIDGGAAPASE